MIKFKDVYFKYPNSREFVLENINLIIKEGEIIAIMGDNGAGKTTLAKHMNGLLKPLRGDVFVDETNTKNAAVSDLSRKVALVFQYPEKMFFSENVWEEIAFALRNFGYDETLINKLVEKTLKMFWLWRYKDSSPYVLSGGEQRRLAIASVVVWDPKYIIFDEPTAGQDAIQREILLNIIRMMIKKGKSVIMITHDVEFIAEISPRIVLLNKGKIIFDGKSSELFRKTDLLLSCNLMQPYIYRLETVLIKKGAINRLAKDFDELVEMIVEIKRGQRDVKKYIRSI